jgi:hypothetical protein
MKTGRPKVDPTRMKRALKKARILVETHQPKPISKQAQREIDEIIRETEKEFN